MSAVGFDTGGVDGRFGAKTESAVKTLQQQYSLSVDGVVGTQTWQVVDALEDEGGVSWTHFTGVTRKSALGDRKDNYGDVRRYNNIVRANPLIVSDPDRIFPGQQLKIPIGAQ
jgi:peptidoglycan hydrolase-like protein with peptidoglycan-binding domain